MKVHFSSLRLDWKTPKAVYQVLDSEFKFDFDPCPVNPTFDGLNIEWGGATMLIRPMGMKYQNGLKRDMKNTKKAKVWFS